MAGQPRTKAKMNALQLKKDSLALQASANRARADGWRELYMEVKEEAADLLRQRNAARAECEELRALVVELRAAIQPPAATITAPEEPAP